MTSQNRIRAARRIKDYWGPVKPEQRKQARQMKYVPPEVELMIQRFDAKVATYKANIRTNNTFLFDILASKQEEFLSKLNEFHMCLSFENLSLIDDAFRIRLDYAQELLTKIGKELEEEAKSVKAFWQEHAKATLQLPMLSAFTFASSSSADLSNVVHDDNANCLVFMKTYTLAFHDSF
ncbi:MAG TPA: hypothetical protein VM577_02570, partial [Anaerovoracaceae bacterium]|nr:hypothetical protein [Anaerovoracaceae bacterium]